MERSDSVEGIEPEGTAEKEGMAEKVVNRVKRAAGAVQRAARGALGKPEAGEDLLFQVLHADHEEVAQLFEKVLASPEGDRLIDLWGRLSSTLTAHNLAETEIVYGCLSALASTKDRIPRSIEEHNAVDRMLAEADAMKPGTEEFFALVSDIRRAVIRHVDEEEGTLLPNARSALSEQARDDLVAEFRKRKAELLPEVEEEIEPVLERERRELQSGDLDDGDEEPDPGRVRPEAQPGKDARGYGKKESNLDRRTVKELKDMARSKGIEGWRTMSKPDLVRTLARR
jgi:hemerythrin superfamily protein